MSRSRYDLVSARLCWFIHQVDELAAELAEVLLRRSGRKTWTERTNPTEREPGPVRMFLERDLGGLVSYGVMKMQGTYKIANQHRVFDALLDPLLQSDRRMQRIIESLRQEIVEGASVEP